MKNVKFRGKKTNSAVNSVAQILRQKPKFRGSARNYAARGKLWALMMTDRRNMFIQMCPVCVEYCRILLRQMKLEMFVADKIEW